LFLMDNFNADVHGRMPLRFSTNHPHLIPEEDHAWLEMRSLRRELRVGDVRSSELLTRAPSRWRCGHDRIS
jgi:hypothetical protein